MMYNEKFIACLKVGGKILREDKDTVYVPFGSEFAVYLKNLNTVRAVVHVEIDGTDVCPSGLVIDANQSVDLERFIKNNNLSSGNRFKFIERTAGIEQHRGVKAEDGIVHITFQFEKPRPAFIPFFKDEDTDWKKKSLPPQYPPYNSMQWGTYVNGTGNSNLEITPQSVSPAITRGMIGSTDACLSNASHNSHIGPTSYSANEVGITVPGSISDQKFSTTTVGSLESATHTIVLHMLGETAERKVEKPVTVKTKPVCTTCGRTNKATSKFCSNCGTSLVLV